MSNRVNVLYPDVSEAPIPLKNGPLGSVGFTVNFSTTLSLAVLSAPTVTFVSGILGSPGGLNAPTVAFA